MNKSELFPMLKEIIIDIKGEIEFDENTALIESGILDSLEVINYLTQIEEKTGMEIKLDELQEHKLGIINNMIEFISSKI